MPSWNRDLTGRITSDERRITESRIRSVLKKVQNEGPVTFNISPNASPGAIARAARDATLAAVKRELFG